MKKRVIALLLVFVLAMASLVGCGGSGDGGKGKVMREKGEGTTQPGILICKAQLRNRLASMKSCLQGRAAKPADSILVSGGVARHITWLCWNPT